MKLARMRRHILISLTVVVAMFGFGYAMVPLYNVMCKALGINGKTGGATTYQAGTKIDKEREITVEFMTTLNEQMPWKFYPLVKKVTVHPGERKRVAFFAENDADHDMTVQAIPSLAPGRVAKYFKKIECFCFTQQFMKKHAARDMPMIFYIDPNIPKDINTVTLSYTMFDVTDIVNKAKKAKERA